MIKMERKSAFTRWYKQTLDPRFTKIKVIGIREENTFCD